MAEYNIGASGGSFEDLTRRAQQGAQQINELNQAEERRRQVTEKTAGTEEASATVRRDLASETERLSASVKESATTLGLETEAIAANTAALRVNLELRRQISASPLVAHATQVSGVAREPTRTSVAPAPVVAAAADPAAAQSIAAAQRRLAEAEIAATAARGEVASTRRAAGVTPERLQPLVEQRDIANQQLQAARRELRATQRSAETQQEINNAKAQERAETQRINAELAAERTAVARATAAQVSQAASVVSGARPLTLGPGREPRQITQGTGELFYMPGAGGGEAPAVGPRRQFNMPGGPGWYGVSSGGGPSEPRGLPANEEAAAQLQSYRERATANAQTVAQLTASQREANLAFHEAGAAYADASTRLTRHGALTTEFIGALARGQVTLREFGDQMVATIGKFGGWAVAGAAVYGAVGAFRDLLKGATDTQDAIQGMSRFIPGLGGPAGGGRGLVGPAAGTLQSISTQFNVPIKEVGDAMGVTSRVFHNLSDSADAARAILVATKLDQVSLGPATQYILGISQSLGYRGRGQGNPEAAPLNVINSLNALQDVYGARVAQTLPGVARAAPIAAATGLDVPALEVLTGLGVRAGLTGPQVGTGILRSMANFAFSPSSELTFRQYGLNPQIGRGGDLVRQVFDLIDEHARRGENTDPLVRNLSRALGGPLQGSRVIAPLLEQEALQPGTFREGLQALHTRTYQEDLSAVLGSVTERFHAIGIALQNFGSKLYEAGAFTPILALLDAFKVLTVMVERLVSPITDALGVLGALPDALKEVLGALVAWRVGTAFLARRFPESPALGRIPGFQGFRDPAREEVGRVTGRLETYLMPEQQARTEAASLAARRAEAEARGAVTAQAQYEARYGAAANLPRGSAEGEAYQAGLAKLTQRREELAAAAERAERASLTQTERLAEMDAQLVILKDRSLPFVERQAFAEQQGMVLTTQTVDLKERLVAAYRAQLAAAEGGVAGIRGGAGERGGGGGAVAGAEAAATAGVIGAAVARGAGDGIRAVVPAVAPTEPRPQPTRAAVTPAEESAVVEARLGAIQQAQLLGATGIAAIGQRASRLIDEAPARLASAREVLTGPGAPIAALLGTQLLGAAIPGATGQFVTNVGGTAAGGALLAQMLGRGPGGIALGAAAATQLASIQQGGLTGGPSVGAALGTAIGAGLGLLGGPFDPITAPFGALAGGLVGSFVGGMVSPPASPEKQAADWTRRAQLALRRVFAQQSPQEQLAYFGADTSQDITDITFETGATQQAATVALNAKQQSVIAQQQLYGLGGPLGGGRSTQLLSRLISGAIGGARDNPALALQVIQSASQPVVQSIQQQFQGSLAQATTPQGAQAAAAAAQQAYQQTIGGAYDQAVQDAQTALDRAHSYLHQAIEKGATGLYKNAIQWVKDRESQLTATKAAAGFARQAQTAANQARAQQALQSSEQDIASQSQLDAARAGGSTMEQLQAGHRKANADLQAAQDTPGLSPHDRRIAVQNALSEATTNWTQQVQYQATRVQAGAQLAAAQATQPGDPVSGARAAIGATQTYLSFLKAHHRAFDPTQIMQVETQLTQEQTALTQSIAEQATQMSTLAGQLAAARDYGDQLAQARDIAVAAERVLAESPVSKVGPVAHRQALLNAAQAQNAVFDAQRQQLQEQAQLAQSLHPNDQLSSALTARDLAQRELATAHGYDQQVQAQSDLNNANTAISNALSQRATAVAQEQAALHPNDAVLQAQIILRGAGNARAQARGFDAVIQADFNYAQAQNALNEAIVQRDISIGELRASTTAEPLQKLAFEIGGARNALRDAVGPDARRQQQTNLNNLLTQRAQTAAQQREDTINFEFQMQQIGASEAVKMLQGILRMSGITNAFRQQLREQIRRYQLGLEQPIGGNTFDLAPGNIRLPTFYDVFHGVRGARQAAMNTRNAINAPTQINVYVRQANDVPKVADAIDRATSSNLRHRLRAAGVR